MTRQGLSLSPRGRWRVLAAAVFVALVFYVTGIVRGTAASILPGVVAVTAIALVVHRVRVERRTRHYR